MERAKDPEMRQATRESAAERDADGPAGQESGEATVVGGVGPSHVQVPLEGSAGKPPRRAGCDLRVVGMDQGERHWRAPA